MDVEPYILPALACMLTFGVTRAAARQPASWPLMAALAICGAVIAFILMRANLTGRAALLALVAVTAAAVLGIVYGRPRATR